MQLTCADYESVPKMLLSLFHFCNQVFTGVSSLQQPFQQTQGREETTYKQEDV